MSMLDGRELDAGWKPVSRVATRDGLTIEIIYNSSENNEIINFKWKRGDDKVFKTNAECVKLFIDKYPSFSGCELVRIANVIDIFERFN